jgi:hypothetical protein
MVVLGRLGDVKLECDSLEERRPRRGAEIAGDLEHQAIARCL